MTIFTHLAPNISFRDMFLLSSFFVCPWKWNKWQKGSAQQKVTQWFSQYLDTEHVYLLDSGRSALLVGLQALEINTGDEVIVPGYTCIVVLNAVRAVGATPVLVDIDHTGNINTALIANAITPKTKAIMAQHTFGLPCDIKALQMICKEQNIYLIEDCAHALGAHVAEQPVGTFGDMSFFSFGSDKIVSTVRGGALVIYTIKVARKADTLVAELNLFPKKQLWQHIRYMSAFFKSKKIYRGGGKGFLYLFSKLGWTAKIIEPIEKEGKMADWTPCQYPNMFAAILLPQLKQLYTLKMKRRILAEYYRLHLSKEVLFDTYAEDTERTYLHFPINISDVKTFQSYMKKKYIQIGTDWNGVPIVPRTAMKKDWQVANIPQAIELSSKIVQLPIHQNMTVRKVKKVVQAVNMYVEK